jgi:hypothetical protein
MGARLQVGLPFLPFKALSEAKTRRVSETHQAEKTTQHQIATKLAYHPILTGV